MIVLCKSNDCSENCVWAMISSESKGIANQMMKSSVKEKAR